MKIVEDGVIKYDDTNFTLTKALNSSEIQELESLRKILHHIKLIGAYEENGIGYGNLSFRRDYSAFLKTTNSQFLISGTQTGHLKNLSGEHYTRVTDYDINHFKIIAHGPIKASSESLSHAAIYEASSKINTIIHIHSMKIWKGMLKDNFPKTDKDIPYGSKEMALAVQNCIHSTVHNYFVMEGHEEGVVIYGKTPEEALNATIMLYQKYIDSNFNIENV